MEPRPNFSNLENQKISSVEQEKQLIQNEVLEKEKNIDETNPERQREQAIKQTLSDYSKKQPEDILEKGTLVSEQIRNEIVLELSPEEHDEKMARLVDILQTKGIANTLSIVQKTENAHVQDDFHRFLVQYVKEGLSIKDYSIKSEIAKILNRTLFEVVLPDFRGNSDESFKDLYYKMQQFYTGMLSISNNKDYLTMELANPLDSRQFVFYVSVPNSILDLFEKQILSILPDARIEQKNDDFNIFNDDGYAVGCQVLQKEVSAKPIKTIDDMNTDPIKVLLNVFSKLDEVKEGAAVQIIFKPVKDFYTKAYVKGLGDLDKGKKDSEKFYIRNTLEDKIMRGVNMAIQTPFKLMSKNDEDKPKENNSKTVEQVTKKIKSEVVSTNIRIVASSKTEERAEAILSEIKSSFNQFDNTQGNRFSFKDIKKKHRKKFFKSFSFREFESDYDVPLSIEEVSSILYFVSEQKDMSPQLKTSGFKTAPSPVDIAKSGVLLGKNKHRNMETDIYYSEKDRLRHFYVIGQTGTGKSTILDNMIIQDIKNGNGACFIDPHGSDVQIILANIPPERIGDVIYFDPSNIERPMALNMLEYDTNHPEQKTFVVNELFSIFQKLYGESNPESMGPMFEQYFRNATMLVIEDPETGNTLLDVSRVLVDKEFRELKLSKCKNPVVVNAWRENLEKAGGEASLQNVVPYITSKFDVFLANDIMRPIIAQEKSSFNFREIMDNKKILLVNLSKGRLGEINSNLIGLILVGKILMAALSRVDSFGKEMPPFYLYIDEFQNITTPSISSILSEARKYGLSLNIAHQFIDQLSDSIRESVFGNVGTICAYRVGSKDAEFLESQFSPVFEAKDIQNIDNFNAYIKMLSNGVPLKPFSLRALPPPEGNIEQVESLKQLSYLKFGKPRIEIETEIQNRYNKIENKNTEKNPFSGF